MIAAAPERTVTSIVAALQARYPQRHPDVQLRTLQRGIGAWRATVLLPCNDGWLDSDAPLDLRDPGTRPARRDGGPAVQAMP
jgi:hypothetical protein